MSIESLHCLPGANFPFLLDALPFSLLNICLLNSLDFFFVSLFILLFLCCLVLLCVFMIILPLRPVSPCTTFTVKMYFLYMPLLVYLAFTLSLFCFLVCSHLLPACPLACSRLSSPLAFLLSLFMLTTRPCLLESCV